jgi:hypothetical protein
VCRRPRDGQQRMGKGETVENTRDQQPSVVWRSSRRNGDGAARKMETKSHTHTRFAANRGPPASHHASSSLPASLRPRQIMGCDIEIAAAVLYTSIYKCDAYHTTPVVGNTRTKQRNFECELVLYTKAETSTDNRASPAQPTSSCTEFVSLSGSVVINIDYASLGPVRGSYERGRYGPYRVGLYEQGTSR